MHPPGFSQLLILGDFLYESGEYMTDREKGDFTALCKYQTFCDDVISRESAINAISEALEHVVVENEDVARKMMNKLPSVTLHPKAGYISIDNVMSVFDDYMRGDVNEDDRDTFFEMLKDKVESEE